MNTQKPSRYFSVVLELSMWIIIWSKKLLKVIANEGLSGFLHEQLKINVREYSFRIYLSELI